MDKTDTTRILGGRSKSEIFGGKSAVCAKGAAWNRTTPAAFWARVNKSAPGNCWEWTGSLNTDGYGRVFYGGAGQMAHRLAWFLEKGAWPSSTAFLCHHCDNRKCVNPTHLYEGDARTNAKDSVVRGRNWRGERHHRARLTWDDVDWIRSLQGLARAKVMAEEFGVSKDQIYSIWRNDCWKDWGAPRV